MLLIYAALRREELLWLTLDDVDLQAGAWGMIRVRPDWVSHLSMRALKWLSSHHGHLTSSCLQTCSMVLPEAIAASAIPKLEILLPPTAKLTNLKKLHLSAFTICTGSGANPG
jgi:hypothetical protein